MDEDVLRVVRMVRLGRSRTIIAVIDAPDTRLPEVLDALDGIDHVHVCAELADLEAAPEGALVLVAVHAEDATALNLGRAAFSARRLCVVLWCAVGAWDALAVQAPDFVDWVSHTVEIAWRLPAFARAGWERAQQDRAALGVSWQGPGWEALAGVRNVGSVADPYDELVARARGAAWIAAQEVDDFVRVGRALWVAAEAGVRLLMVDAGVEPPGFWRLHARPAPLREAAKELRSAGSADAGREAIVRGLEPEALTLGGFDADAIACRDAPAAALRRWVDDPRVAPARRRILRRAAAAVRSGRSAPMREVAVWASAARRPPVLGETVIAPDAALRLLPAVRAGAQGGREALWALDLGQRDVARAWVGAAGSGPSAALARSELMAVEGTGSFDEALALAERAWRDDGSTRAAVHISELLASVGERDGAKDLLARAADTTDDPRDAVALTLASATVLYLEGDRDRARAIVATLDRLDPIQRVLAAKIAGAPVDVDDAGRALGTRRHPELHADPHDPSFNGRTLAAQRALADGRPELAAQEALAALEHIDRWYGARPAVARWVACTTAGKALTGIADFDGAARCWLRAAEDAHQLRLADLPVTAMLACSALAEVGAFGREAQVATWGIEFAERSGDRARWAWLAFRRAAARLCCGEIEGARADASLASAVAPLVAEAPLSSSWKDDVARARGAIERPWSAAELAVVGVQAGVAEPGIALLHVAARFGALLDALVRDVQRAGHLGDVPADALTGLTGARSDLVWLSERLDGAWPWVGPVVDAAHLARASSALAVPAEVLAERVAALAPLVGRRLEG